MLERREIPIDKIHVPVKRVRTLDPGRVTKLAESILEEGLRISTQVRSDGDRHVLVEGLHSLEACRSLGDETIGGYMVQARVK